VSSRRYERRQAERTPLYKIVAEHLESWFENRAVDDNGGGDTGGESQPPQRMYVFPLLVDFSSSGRLVAMSSSCTCAWALD